VWRLPRQTLNLGILAHVDAGKTTLTERLLYAAGVIDTVGSVDEGTTQTDALALERERGITIKSAVVSFEVSGVTVNLIDTPGHPDFIAEVERVLSLLDGAVLVISAVEGVQPQTRVLMRALRRLGVPTLLFINKIDRGGADPDRVLAAIRGRLSDAIVAMGTVEAAGTRRARFTPKPPAGSAVVETLAAGSDALLAAYVDNEATVTAARLGKELAEQTGSARVHPVYCGSAITGEGVPELMSGLVELLPVGAGDETAAPEGRVFKIERGPAGERIVYLRMFAGTLHARQRVPVAGAGREAKPTQISVAERGGWVRRPVLRAGEIGRVFGLDGVRIGDTLGVPGLRSAAGSQFPPPTMATVVAPVRPRDDGALRAALARLAEQDPLINVRVDEGGREVAVSLYGEVQKEVIEATLADEYGIPVTFRETTTICVERPAGTGEAVDIRNTPGNPFSADIGLRVEPGRRGSGLEFRIGVEPRSLPLHLYRNVEGFTAAMGEYLRATLREGRYGWQVTDCVVTLVEIGHVVADGPPSRRGPDSSTTDFRNLTPMVLMDALERARTVVCEPTLRVSLEVPVWAISGMLRVLGRLGAPVHGQTVRGELTTIETVLPAARLSQLRSQVPGATAGEGVVESTFDGYRRVPGEPPVRARTTADPRHRKEYLNSLTREGARS
jgi:ribosomal protection tetracycline resistance protein